MKHVAATGAAGGGRWVVSALVAVGGIAGWAAFVWVTLRYLGLSRDLWQQQPFFIHLDWHAYAAGAHQLAAGTLYRVPLALGETPVPLDTFNLPPLAAAEAAPFLVFGLLAGGLAWQAAAAGAVAFAAYAMAGLWRGSALRGIAFAGVILGAYMLVDHVLVPDPESYWWGLALGTNNYAVVGLLAGFVFALHRRHERTAGVLLGIAIATKLWPVTIAAALIRNRSWTALRWSAGICVVQGLVFAAWLGPDVLPDFARSLLVDDPQAETIIGVSALRDLLPWWPAWAGWLVAGMLLAVPVRGHAATGVAILAGLAVITNLWGHYLPTIVFAAGLVVTGWMTEVRPARRRETIAGDDGSANRSGAEIPGLEAEPAPAGLA